MPCSVKLDLQNTVVRLGSLSIVVMEVSLVTGRNTDCKRAGSLAFVCQPDVGSCSRRTVETSSAYIITDVETWFEGLT